MEVFYLLKYGKLPAQDVPSVHSIESRSRVWEVPAGETSICPFWSRPYLQSMGSCQPRMFHLSIPLHSIEYGKSLLERHPSVRSIWFGFPCLPIHVIIYRGISIWWHPKIEVACAHAHSHLVRARSYNFANWIELIQSRKKMPPPGFEPPTPSIGLEFDWRSRPLNHHGSVKMCTGGWQGQW